MNKLVFIENGRPVTDSLTVAEVFDKEHKRVLQDIRELGCSEEFGRHNFVPISYKDSMNRDKPKYLLTEQGFTLLVMGYTGHQAMEFKEKYISEFHRIREELGAHKESNVVPLNERQALIKSLQLTVELAGEMEEVKTIAHTHSQKLIELEQKVDEQITLDHGEQRTLQKAVSRKIYEIEHDPRRRAELFRQLYREIKDRWTVASYRDVKRTELKQVIRYVEAWMPRRIA
ncbi:Rha family transcriptional regulator [Brevibacillus reuszeri]|uniref:Rha family transcriptional regulator n=1 Tax=Brevibacillus reuszeri TaxID=54915 RepID=UPI000CCC2D6E|nr:Rha family transcriptional regulator [Brevibacillus reuszeri]